MGFVESIQSGFRNYANFEGRAPRSEYWFFHLFVFLAVCASFFTIFFVWLVCLALFLPSLAVNVRRLHDIDKSGWLILIGFVPIAGAIVLLIWHCQRGTLGGNRFGPDPLPGL
jgi:uncharacterized membrane protein YhaH (DUF805 family)